MSYDIDSYMPRIEQDLRNLRNQMVAWVVACSMVAAAAAATVVVWRTSGTGGQINALSVQVRDQVAKLESQVTTLQGVLDQQRHAAAEAAAPEPVQPPARRPGR
ncbi:MAG TPA: hypothetical protein VMW56_26330 [Candidatus Margulisiibacteriota bacterium]|nr:hypothetical protein [Candidatus Margulisiibacteriota bacterium]